MRGFWRPRGAGDEPSALPGGAGASAPGAAEADELSRARQAIQAMQSIAGQAGQLGRGAAELDGVIVDTVALGQRQVEEFDGLAQGVQAMVDANQRIDDAVGAGREAVEQTRQAVALVGDEVLSVVTSLREVAAAATDITQIALQTRLVAFNATVEAKRAGEAGAGFAVVADAVKDLAGKVERSSKQIMSTVAQLDQRIDQLATNLAKQRAGAQASGFHLALGRVEGSVDQIAEQARHNLAECRGVITAVRAMSDSLADSSRSLQQVGANTRDFLKASEMLIELSADSGVQTPDTPFIAAVTEAAARLGGLLEQAVAQGRISLADLFDEQYQAVAGSNPAQLMTRFVALTDELFPAVQEPMLQLDAKVVFCAAVDRNGFLPTHNRKFSQPQGSDPVWNAANCRNRRLFNDRTGLAAGRNQRRFLLQTYRRDMGGGRMLLMKDLSAPITVQGRHWGGLRLAYGFGD